MKKVEETGSLRIDLLGGTLDLHPIGLLIPNSCTLNFATSLKTRVSVQKIQGDLMVESIDYGTKKTFKAQEFTDELLYGGHFSSFSLVAHILHHFDISEGVHLTISSDSPPGAGLGGSSTMGVVLYKALCRFSERKFAIEEAVSVVKDMEACILQSPAGYQDYYPALCGGVLALRSVFGRTEVEQLYRKELADFIEENFTLVYSGVGRLSGVNNWEVFKSFFDANQSIQKGLKKIAQLSHQAMGVIKKGHYKELLQLVSREGEYRRNLFTKIATKEMNILFKRLKKEFSFAGMKVCGAGGGGHFLVAHHLKDARKIEKIIEDSAMKKVPFRVGSPL